MNPPSPLVRFAGSARNAPVLYCLFGVAVVGWFAGSVPWWMGLFALLMIGRTRDAVRRVRTYKAWLSEWQSMGGEAEETPPPRKKRKYGWALVTGAALLVLVGVPWSMPSGAKASDAVLLLWGAAGLYLVCCVVWKLFRLLRIFTRPAARRTAEADAESAPVALLVGRPAFSPSRAAAERELPEYCARLIDGSLTLPR